MSSGDWTASCVPSDVVHVERAAFLARVADYVELSKPRIAALVLVTVAVGHLLGSGGTWNGMGLAGALAGIGLIAVAGAAFNQVFERKTDARMARTANRPLPAGRLQPIEATLFAFACSISGLAILFLSVNTTTAVLGFLTLVLYAAVYTPLKRFSGLATAVGAIPGALPPVLGWTSAGSPLGWDAFSLFAILYLWQFPHFLAIAWIYRRHYTAAGLRMLPGIRSGETGDNSGSNAGERAAGAARTGKRAAGPTEFAKRAAGPTRSGHACGVLACFYASALIPASLLPGQFALAGDAYRIAAVILGFGYLAMAFRFFLRESSESARGLLWYSLIYLPALLAVLSWDHVRLLS